MAYQVTCPCGETMYGFDRGQVVASTQTHLGSVHQRTYSDDEIMFMASEIPDRLVPSTEF